MKQETKARLIALVGATIVKLLVATLRVRVRDPHGFLALPLSQRIVGIFWHNRLLIIPHFFKRYMRPRTARALASASKDGEIVAAFLARYGIGAIRGSSSRRGALALAEMRRAIAEGHEIAITPDGPRGPCYHLNPGVVSLAQTTDTPVLPVVVHYTRCWTLKSWDAFQIPKPFSAVEITLFPLEKIAVTDSSEAFEKERARLEQAMRDAHAPAP